MLDNFQRRWFRGADILTGIGGSEPHDWCQGLVIAIGMLVCIPIWLVLVLISWPTGRISEIRENRREGIRTVR